MLHEREKSQHMHYNDNIDITSILGIEYDRIGLSISKSSLEYALSDTIKGYNEFLNRCEENGDNNNTGDSNVGEGNSGYGNVGDYNSGNRNVGFRNTGFGNNGHRNTGRGNTGSMNTGNENAGVRNTGSKNMGNNNTGIFNTCNNSCGAFNTIPQKVYMFNKPTDLSAEDVADSEAAQLLSQVFIGNLSYSGFEQWFNRLDDDRKKLITSLPNFDKKIFNDITDCVIEEEGSDNE